MWSKKFRNGWGIRYFDWIRRIEIFKGKFYKVLDRIIGYPVLKTNILYLISVKTPYFSYFLISNPKYPKTKRLKKISDLSDHRSNIYEHQYGTYTSLYSRYKLGNSVWPRCCPSNGNLIWFRRILFGQIWLGLAPSTLSLSLIADFAFLLCIASSQILNPTTSYTKAIRNITQKLASK